jgi:DNA-binding CsgD family transcriptional regulator
MSQFTVTLSDSLSTIETEIQSLTEELAQLENARTTLVTLLTNDDEIPVIRVTDKEAPARKVRVKKSDTETKTTTKTNGVATTQRERIEQYLRDGKSPKWIAEKIGHSTPSYVYKVKGEMTDTVATAKPDTNKKVSSGTTQRAKILALLDKGVSPKAIAERLNTHVSYVYTVKNS